MSSVIHNIEVNRVIDYYLDTQRVSKSNKAELIAINDDLLHDFRIYQIFGWLGNFHSISSYISTVSEDNKGILELLYSKYLAKSGVRSLIFSRRLLCPGCQQGYATARSTLDHFLPSSNYPNFYVLPQNLIPTCGDCNRIKNDVIPRSKTDNLPHPYFDTVLFNKNWLKVVVLKKQKPLNYTFELDDSLNKKEQYKVLNHLIAYKLEDTLFQHVNSVFDEHDDDFKDCFENGGGKELKNYIDILHKEGYVSPGQKKFNSINVEHIFFKALYDSDWFCNRYYL